MPSVPKLTGSDLKGVMAYPPTPALPGAERVESRDTVDLVESERMIRALIADGVDAIALNGTLGEMASLTIEEWKAFAGCVAAAAISKSSSPSKLLNRTAASSFTPPMNFACNATSIFRIRWWASNKSKSSFCRILFGSCWLVPAPSVLSAISSRFAPWV